MTSFPARRPTSADAPAVAEMVAAHERAICGSSSYALADLEDEWRTLDLERDAWVLESDGDVAAYGTVEDRGELWRLDGYVHPAAFGRGLGTQLVRTLEADALARGARRVQNGVLEADEAALAIMTALGYRTVRRFRELRITHAAEPARPRYPEGLTVAAFDPADARAFHAAQQEAFADHWEHHPRAFESWAKQHFDADGYDPTLWRVVRDGDAIVAGMTCRGGVLGAGWVEFLFTRRPWRRRGIGEALVRDAFHLFWQRGEPTVGLGVDAQSDTGAFRLYERLGMTAAVAAVIFERAVPDAA
jgi:mycothiol synthase